MPTGLPQRFDPQRLVVQDDVLRGRLDTGMMPRLLQMLARRQAVPVDLELRAYRDEAQRLVLEGRAGAVLSCVCQRCMEPVELDVDANFALAVVADEEAARQLPAELDPLLLEGEPEVNLPELVEDELILALPPVPVHADIEDCGERARLAGSDEEHDSDEKRENPFAVLKKLKDGNSD